jgi:hypothetical protein
MKLEDLAFNRVLGFEPKVEDINVPKQGGGTLIRKSTSREFSFNGCLYTCKVIMKPDETVELIRMTYSKIPTAPVRTIIELTDISDNDTIKKYFEGILLRLKVSIDQIYRETKAKDTFEYINDLGGILKVVDGEVCFELDGFNIKIELNKNDEWDTYLNNKQVSTNKTLRDAFWDVNKIRKENFALIPNIV